MKPIEFEGQTRILRPPQGWDNGGDSLQCGALPIMDVLLEGVPCVQSIWKPSAEDIEALNNGAQICLSIVGQNQPPAVLYVTKMEELP